MDSSGARACPFSIVVSVMQPMYRRDRTSRNPNCGFDRQKEFIMRAKQLFTLTALTFAVCSVLADEVPNAPLTRAQVVQSVRAARAAGMLLPAGEGPAVSEYPQTGAPTSSLTRAEVDQDVLQARAARALEPAGEGQAVPEYPPAGGASISLTRAQVKDEVLEARANGEMTPAGQADVSMEHVAQPIRTAASSSPRLLARIEH